VHDRGPLNLTLFLARRFLRGRGTGLLGTVATLALAGVALGAAALVVGMGLMSGYRGELAEARGHQCRGRGARPASGCRRKS
jgi:ABC-type lipoprotein release transport system permease subunit